MDKQIPIISAVVCSFNRATLLRQCIDSLMDQSLDQKAYEILIVDNKSTDHTRQVALEYTSQTMNVRYIYEGRLGLSHARNRGVEEAKGEYVAFMDDDATADREWLHAIVKCFQSVEPRLAIVGGQVVLSHAGVDIPAGIPDMYFSKLDHGDRSLLVSRNGRLTHYLNGTNFAIRKEVFRQVGPFDIRLGRRGHSLGSREESKFMEEAARRNLAIYYEPAIKVTHFISKDRVTWSFLIRRSFAEGVSSVLGARIRRFPGSRTSFAVQGAKMILAHLLKLIRQREHRMHTFLEVVKMTGVIYAVLFLR